MEPSLIIKELQQQQFKPLYFLHGGISHKNRFEQAADRYARTGLGWWPYGQ